MSALTLNHGNAHYDLGAGGRGVTTDCHDGTNDIIINKQLDQARRPGVVPRIMGFSTT